MRVYKFLNAQYALDAILSGNIKLSTVDELNDPYEFKGVKFTQATKKDNQDLIDIIKKYGLLCVSKNYFNPTMWSHYSDSHKGIVLEFDIKEDEKNEFFTVKYVDKIIENNKPFNDIKKNYFFLEELLATKSKDWCYENEVRFLFDLKDDYIPKSINGDLKFFINMEEKGFILQKVILGCMCNTDLELKIKNALIKKNVTLLRASLDLTLFKVNSIITF
jgi:hypothetical protein